MNESYASLYAAASVVSNSKRAAANPGSGGPSSWLAVMIRPRSPPGRSGRAPSPLPVRPPGYLPGYPPWAAAAAALSAIIAAAIAHTLLPRIMPPQVPGRFRTTPYIPLVHLPRDADNAPCHTVVRVAPAARCAARRPAPHRLHARPGARLPVSLRARVRADRRGCGLGAERARRAQRLARPRARLDAAPAHRLHGGRRPRADAAGDQPGRERRRVRARRRPRCQLARRREPPTRSRVQPPATQGPALGRGGDGRRTAPAAGRRPARHLPQSRPRGFCARQPGVDGAARRFQACRAAAFPPRPQPRPSVVARGRPPGLHLCSWGPLLHRVLFVRFLTNPLSPARHRARRL